MKVGDFVKVDPKAVSPLTLKLHNGNPMGLVVWCSSPSGSPEVWVKVMLLNGRELSFPQSVIEVINEE